MLEKSFSVFLTIIGLICLIQKILSKMGYKKNFYHMSNEEYNEVIYSLRSVVSLDVYLGILGILLAIPYYFMKDNNCQCIAVIIACHGTWIIYEIIRMIFAKFVGKNKRVLVSAKKLPTNIVYVCTMVLLLLVIKNSIISISIVCILIGEILGSDPFFKRIDELYSQLKELKKEQKFSIFFILLSFFIFQLSSPIKWIYMIVYLSVISFYFCPPKYFIIALKREINK